MPALLIALLALVPAGALLLRVNRRRFRFRLDQFRPAAPLTGLLPTDRDLNGSTTTFVPRASGGTRATPNPVQPSTDRLT